MSSKLPRRDFLLAWLGGLLASWLGRSKAQAAPNAVTGAAPLCPPTEPDASEFRYTTPGVYESGMRSTIGGTRGLSGYTFTYNG
jgi:hypothetical protein